MNAKNVKRLKLVALLVFIGSLDVYFFGKDWYYAFLYITIYYVVFFWFKMIKWVLNEKKQEEVVKPLFDSTVVQKHIDELKKEGGDASGRGDKH